MNCCPTIPVAPRTPTSIFLVCMVCSRLSLLAGPTPARLARRLRASLGPQALSKKNPPTFLEAGGCCDPCYEFGQLRDTRSHTPGLRIRFVRFRQTVWGVVQIVTIVGQYNRWAPGRSNLGSAGTRSAVRDARSGIRDPGSGIRDPWYAIRRT